MDFGEDLGGDVGHDFGDPELIGRFVARVRRRAGLSQRELARRVGVGHSTIGSFEAGQRLPALSMLSTILGVAGLRLAVVDREGTEVAPIPAGVVRDRGDRRYPSHHDVAPGDEAPDWARHDGRVAHRFVRQWSIRGEERDRRRDRRGDQGAEPFGDHPTVAELVDRERLRRRFPTVRVRVDPATLPTPTCTCLDACFETICRPDCPCGCETFRGDRASS